MAGDWIRLHRKALNSRAFSDPWLWQLWSWCLLNANWKKCWKFGRELQPGQFATDCRSAAEWLNASKTRVHRGLHTLQEWGQVQLEVVKRTFTVVTICNWKAYQCEDDEARDTSGTQAGHARDTSGTTSLSEEGEEGKKGRAPPRVFVKPTVEDVAAYCRERGNSVDPVIWWNHYESNGWRVGRSAMKDWKAAVITWEKRQGDFGRPKPPPGPRPPTDAEVAERLRRQREEDERRPPGDIVELARLLKPRPEEDDEIPF